MWYAAGLVACLLTGAAAAADAGTTGETRTYLDVEYTAAKKNAGRLRLAFKPFLRIENRFRNSGPVYEQWNAGFRLRVLSWLSMAAYYTPRVLMYPGKPNAFKKANGADIVFNRGLGPFILLDRVANEWYATDRFFRLRNLSRVTYKTAIPGIAVYVGDEFRLDPDEERINMNNMGGGLGFAPSPSLSLDLNYEIEANRRGLSGWQRVHFLGVTCASHL